MTDRPAEQTVTAVRSEELCRARRALVVVGVVLPVVLTAVAGTFIALWLPELPDPVATHWGVDGADGFGSPSAYLWLAIGTGLVLPAAVVISTLAMSRRQWGGASRLLGAVALGLSGLSAVISAGSVALQRGLADAAQASSVVPVILAGFGALLVLTAVGWVLQPDVRPTPAVPLKPAHLASIASGERVVWMGTATMPRVGMIMIGVITVLIVGIAAVMIVQAYEGMWIPLLVLAIIGFAFASTASFRVRAGADGLTIRSQIGFPSTHVPLDEIVSVRAVECHPFGEFGGFGWRVGVDGRTGVVLRTGPAIEVERRGGRRLVVTVEGAEVGASVLQAYLDRAGRSSASSS